ncbi:MAG: hypothetical protein U5S82_19865 [Gammaproteobacteria bacterium]|nr:hypothetical protein [Gammaproteobacteria bacterium]
MSDFKPGSLVVVTSAEGLHLAVVLNPPRHTESYREAEYQTRDPIEVYKVLFLDDEEEYYVEGWQLQSFPRPEDVVLVAMEED